MNWKMICLWIILMSYCVLGSGSSRISKPDWNISPNASFESDTTLFTCDITNVDCNPPNDHIFVQKYVQTKWHNAVRVNKNKTHVVEPLPGGHTIEGRITVDYNTWGNRRIYSVVLEELVLEDGGDWKCVTKDCDSESELDTLTIMTAISRENISITQPSHILLGDSTEYRCTSAKVNPEFAVTWNLQGHNYTNGTSNNEDNEFYHVIRNTNDFTFCEDRDTAVTCILHTSVWPGWSAQNTVFQSNVYAPAKIEDSKPSNKNPVITDVLTMECTASGTDRLVKWQKDGDDKLDGLFTEQIIYITDGKFTCGESNGTESVLTWIQYGNSTCDDVVKHDGSYKCEVTGVEGTSDISEEHVITVLYGPIISGDTETVIDALLGTEVKMTCDTDCARPDVMSYTWTSLNDRDGLEADAQTISIVITLDDFNDTFTCIVNNTVGKNERTFVINEIYVDPPPTTEDPTTLTITTPDGNVTAPNPPNTALIIANAVIWSLCGVVGIVLVCLALYHYRQIQSGKKYQEDDSEEIVLTDDEEKPGTSHGFGSGEYDDISHSVVGKVALGGAFGGVTTEGLYEKVQTSAQTQMPVAPKRTSKIKTSQPESSTPQAKRTHATNAPKSPMNAGHQPDSPSLARRQEPQADYSPASKRKDILPSHSSESNHGMASKVLQQQKRHESPNKQAAVKQNANWTKPSVPVKPDIQSFRSSRSSGIIPAGAPYDNAEFNLYANCDQRPEPKSGDGTITYADLALQQEDPYEEGAPPVPMKNMTDQEPVQYASIKRSK